MNSQAADGREREAPHTRQIVRRIKDHERIPAPSLYEMLTGHSRNWSPTLGAEKRPPYDFQRRVTEAAPKIEQWENAGLKYSKMAELLGIRTTAMYDYMREIRRRSAK